MRHELFYAISVIQSGGCGGGGDLKPISFITSGIPLTWTNDQAEADVPFKDIN